MGWWIFDALFGRHPQAKVRDPWRGVVRLEDLLESMASLVRCPGRDQSARIAELASRLVTMEDQDLRELDRLARLNPIAWSENPTWWSLTPRDLDTLVAISPAGNPHFLGLASFHRSGHVRERALRKLGTLATPATLPYILLRLNDWAEQVAFLAREILPGVVARQSASSALSHLDLALQLRRSTRRDPSSWFHLFLEHLQHLEWGEALRQGLRSPILPSRRICYDLSLGMKALPMEDLLKALREEPDPICRGKVQRALLDHTQGEARRDILRMALGDPVPSCRKAALAWLEETQDPDRARWCEDALLDGNRSVRETAQWSLRQLDRKDLREPYLAALGAATRSQRIAGIHGLGEVGRKADALLILPLARSTDQRLRKAALASIGRLDAAIHADVFLEALTSDHPGISRLASEILLRNGPWPGRDRLLEIYRSASFPHVREGVLAMVQKLPKWQGMAFFLEVMPSHPQDLDPHLTSHLGHWLRSLLHVPPPHGVERAEARARLEAARARLGWRALPEVEGHLG